ncbi:uncharacterized oxidoreductase YrpG-like [Haliotis cracherodii]|uniref:uncharacterized oxidoreductase YrpG-like n=1 Tax=Haliotis cracherodii TaxID=6455 RepID=UPI0039EBA411
MAGTPEMEYRYLGKSGLRVSSLSLGTMMFGKGKAEFPGQCDQEQAHAMLDHYTLKGGNFIDTADIYAGGKSEEIVGLWLQKQRRDDHVVATKVGLGMQHDPGFRGLSRRHITRSLEKSLERLQTSYVDVYQMHMWDKGTPIEETVRTFDDLVRCGKVLYCGASNLTGWMLQKLVDTAERMGSNPFVSLQQRYSLCTRESELDAFEVCRSTGVGITAWGTLMSGILSGKYKRQGTLDGGGDGRMRWLAEEEEGARRLTIFPSWSKLQTDDMTWNTLMVLEKISQKHNKTMSEVAVKWTLQQPMVCSVVLGCRNLAQLDDNMEGGSPTWRLSQQDLDDLDRASYVPRSMLYENYGKSPWKNPFLML